MSAPTSPFDPVRRRLLLASGAAWATGAEACTLLSFALIGDIPYRRGEIAALPALLEDIASNACFALHIGDIKAGAEVCSDELLASRLGALSQLRIPLVYTPGDNEWVDCWRESAGAYDPAERLAWLRQQVFGVTPPILGRRALPLPMRNLQRQRDMGRGLPENLMFEAGHALFVTINLPGSENGQRSPLTQADHAERNDANRHWLAHAAERARDLRLPLLAVAAHANPDLGRGIGPASRADDSYADFREQLARCLAIFPGHVLLMHGDTHRFRVDRIHSRLTRVESFGSPFSGSWVRISLRDAEIPFDVEVRHV